MEFPAADTVASLVDPVDLPPVARVSFDPSVPEPVDVRNATEIALEGLTESLEPGSTVAIGVGSRGIRDIVPITETVVNWFSEHGCDPVVIAAMGSHGGGTAQGQRSVLRELGITEDRIGCPIDTRMQTEVVGRETIGGNRVDVAIATAALEADVILPINRVAPHTSFSGRFESGICKMLAVGFGKREGARVVHQIGRTVGFVSYLEAVIPLLQQHLEILGGIAIIENALGRTVEVVAIPGTKLMTEEPALLERARDHLPTLPFETIDVLIVDEMGKNISGTGMDPNVIGQRIGDSPQPPGASLVKRLYVRSLTEETEGNANGIGFADIVHRDVADDIDFTSTYANVLTSGYLGKAALPTVLPTDELAIRAMISSLGAVSTESLRLGWINNTSNLSTFHATRPLIGEMTSDEVTVQGWHELTFSEGRLALE